MVTSKPIETAIGKRVWLIVHAQVDRVVRRDDYVAVETHESSIDMSEVVGWGLYDATKAEAPDA